MKFKGNDVEKLFENVSCDTKKKLNRSNKVISRKHIEDIEAGLSIEAIEQMPYPIYKYQTQITIHGVCQTEISKYVGRYKNIVVNKNKSIGVRYSAIDYRKKALLERLTNTMDTDCCVSFTSSDFMVYRRIKDKQEAIDYYNSIDDSLFIGNKQVLRDIMFGHYYVICNVDAIYTNKFMNLVRNLTGIQDILSATGKKQMQWNASRRKRAAEEAQERLERKQRAANLVPDLDAILANSADTKVQGNLPKNCILYFYRIDTYMAIIRKCVIWKQGGFYKSKYTTPSFEIPDAAPDRIKRKFSKELPELLKKAHNGVVLCKKVLDK